jgi:hypothetical protein
MDSCHEKSQSTLHYEIKNEYNNKIFMVKANEQSYISQIKAEHNTSNSLNTFIPSSKVDPSPSNDNDTMNALLGDDWESLDFTPCFNGHSKILPSNSKDSNTNDDHAIILSSNTCFSDEWGSLDFMPSFVGEYNIS